MQQHRRRWRGCGQAVGGRPEAIWQAVAAMFSGVWRRAAAHRACGLVQAPRSRGGGAAAAGGAPRPRVPQTPSLLLPPSRSSTHLHRLVQHLWLASAPDRVLAKGPLRLRQEGLHRSAVGLAAGAAVIHHQPCGALLKFPDEAAGTGRVGVGGGWGGQCSATAAPR